MKKFQIISILIALFFVINLNSSYSGPRNVLVEYCTGTWCGYCPCGDDVLNTIKGTYPQTIAIAYHGASTDPWQFFNGYEVRGLLGFSAYPTAIIDRGNTPNNPYVTYNLWYDMVNTRYTSSPNSNVNISVASKSFNSSSRELNLTINSTALENLTGQYKISIALVEDNLVYPQNYYASCGTPGYQPDYVHDHVARSMVNSPTGEDLNASGVWDMNTIITKNINTVLDAAWIPENCKIIIFVYKSESVLALSNVEQVITENVSGPTGISGNVNEIPSVYTLEQNYPNPFNPSTNIKFSLPEDINVSLKIYDLNGKEVADYVNGFLQKGSYNVEFDGTNLSSGIYFYVLNTDNFSDRKKMILIK
jgi:hypothetical protein